MPFGSGLFQSIIGSRLSPGLRTRQALQAPQAQIGAQAPQPTPITRARQVQTMSGGGAMGGSPSMAAPGSQPQDGLQMAAGRPRMPSAPGSMSEASGISGLDSSGQQYSRGLTEDFTPNVVPMDAANKRFSLDAQDISDKAASLGEKRPMLQGVMPRQLSRLDIEAAGGYEPVYDPESMQTANRINSEYQVNPAIRDQEWRAKVATSTRNMAASDFANRGLSSFDRGYNQAKGGMRPDFNAPIGQSDVDLSGNSLDPRQGQALPQQPTINPYDAYLDQAQASAEDRKRRQQELYSQAPQPVNARAQADEEVRGKSPWWRLGQFGLGALKGFVGANPNGGSGILGALSGGVSGATGDLYRQRRVNAIDIENAANRQGFEDKVKTFDKFADNEVAAEKSVVAAARVARQYQNDINDLEIARDKGLIERDRADAEIAKKKAEMVKIDADIAAKQKQLQINQQRVNQIPVEGEKNRQARKENIVTQEDRRDRRLGVTEGGKDKRLNTTQDRIDARKGSGKPLTKSEASTHAQGYALDILDRVYLDKGLGGRKDTEITGKNKLTGRDETVGRQKQKIAEEFLEGEGKNVMAKIASNLMDGLDPFDGLDKYRPVPKKGKK